VAAHNELDNRATTSYFSNGTVNFDGGTDSESRSAINKAEPFNAGLCGGFGGAKRRKNRPTTALG